MSEKQKKVVKKISAIGLIGLFATTFLYMADLSYYPIIGTLFGEFPEASMFLHNTAMTGSQLFVMLAAFAVIPLMKRFSKKALMLVFIAIFIVFGCSCQFIHSMGLLALFRSLSGFGFGATFPLAAALINQVYFADKNGRDRYIGWLSGIMGVTGVINSIMAGVLAAISWNMVFAWYWIAVPIFLIVLFCVPSTPADKDDPNAVAAAEEMAVAAASATEKAKLPVGSFVAMLLAFIVNNIGWFDCATQLSVYLPEHFPDAGVGLASTVQTIGTVGALAIGLVFAPLFHKVKRFFPVIIFGCFFVLYLTYAIGAPVWLLAVTLFLGGIAYAGGMSYYMVYAATILPPDKEATGMALTTVAMAVGGFVAPYCITLLQAVFGFTTVTATFPIFAGVMALATILAIILGIRSTKRGEGIGEVMPEEQAVA